MLRHVTVSGSGEPLHSATEATRRRPDPLCSMVAMTDPHLRDATGLAAALRRGEFSSRELLEHFLARIAALDPRINAIVTLDAERARARADEADAARARGEDWGPLHGVPITVKDSFETAGLRTTAGSPALAQHVPQQDAEAVRRLRAAGAVLLGKTNLPLLAGDFQSYNPLFGITRNPWDPGRTPGGSSGGSAAAIAAGLSALELGSDLGGSIRTPAHWTGVFGLKPTHGLVPLRGHIPGPPGTLAEPDLAVAGPIARSARDLDLALAILAGPLDDLAVAWRLALPPPRHICLRDYRVAAWLDDADYPVDAAAAAVLHEAIEALRREGLAVDDGARPLGALRDAFELYQRLMWPLSAAGFPTDVFARLQRQAEAHPQDASPAGCMARHGTARYRDWARANEARAQQRARFGAFFCDCDVLLMPVNQTTAIAHDTDTPLDRRVVCVNGVERPYLDVMAWISPASSSLHPAAVVPVGRTRAGLPVGLQVVGPYLEDRSVIDFAGRLGELLGGCASPPGC